MFQGRFAATSEQIIKLSSSFRSRKRDMSLVKEISCLLNINSIQSSDQLLKLKRHDEINKTKGFL